MKWPNWRRFFRRKIGSIGPLAAPPAAYVGSSGGGHNVSWDGLRGGGLVAEVKIGRNVGA